MDAEPPSPGVLLVVIVLLMGSELNPIVCRKLLLGY